MSVMMALAGETLKDEAGNEEVTRIRSLGLDLSLSCTGWVILDAEVTPTRELVIQPQWGTIKIPRLMGEARLSAIRTEAWNLLKPFRVGKSHGSPDVVTLEGYAPNPKSMFTTIKLAELAGVVRTELYERGYTAGDRLLTAAPAQAKKFATGSGTGDKEQVREAVRKRWGFEPPVATADNNVIDAYVLARIGLAVILERKGLDAGLTHAQRDVLVRMAKSIDEAEERLDKRRKR